MLLLTLCATAAEAWVRQVKGGGEVAEVKTIDVIASRFQFEPATISVAQGDSVRLRLHSADRTHAFAIKAFRVKALIPKVGEAVTVEFVADQAGTFDFTCAEYCGTGHGGMKGRLVVLPREK
jgi:heme/copper-type cytochrome/quinol oxidase subunit 2